ncbi:type-F conjugative transfer system mating-pair stabilization protein TraN [Piscirickettsia salmonis]|uniref:type-F conjugative transfer system mating-pair stabilization protein TraN n=1 Tax=Piscirickettsia salmonis TaxID=1238 RepID=UPI0006BD8527|nr:type-F conjugative transfer system mating-pair stabilization protein TraN [Piscirickettsia salmonis]ALA26647.1 conjugal transfer protein TraN [Piscirickettsia salmonis]APS45860.1 hypothetical protein AVI48_15620 [Piscirickettsia salmonis]APS49257.1 hypothetical protein AVI49_16505 [Piscirickettsia salmonis]QGO82356.1 conjugal transfer mating pair stabilization protein TraN [Piscirickettsia salmonis]QGP24185.1 conjugal transfer mating pair stabilization protein TraN [Piscirickettsia salmonis
MIKKTVFLGFLIVLNSTLANQTADDYQKDQSTVESNKNTVVSTGTSLDPQKTIPNYTANPSQTGYYQGVQSYGSGLSQDAQNNLKNDPAGNTVYKAFTTRPQIKVNTQSASIQGSKLIENDSYNITHGISDQYVNCTKKPVNCTTTYQSKTCTTGHPYDLTCTRTLSIQMKEKTVYVDKTYTGNMENTGSNSNTYTLPEGGVIESIVFRSDSDHGYAYRQNYTFYLNGKNIGTRSYPCSGWLCFLNNNSSINITADNLGVYVPSSGVVNLRFDGYSYRGRGAAPFTIVMKVKRTAKDPQEVWSTNCNNLPSSCRQTAQKCTQPKETRVVDGVNVTKECWQDQTNYQCGQSFSSSCQALVNQGCEQTSSVCKDASCQEFNDTYNCPVKQCATQMVCAHDVFCIDGDCVKKDPKSNKNFGQDVSELAAAAGAAQDYSDSDQVSIFNGHPMDCSIDVGGFSDCCSDSGWGQGTGLAHCSEEEQKLGHAKEKYLVSYIGEYCAHKVPIVGTCLSHKKVYCVFDNKMARIVQDYGRPQLHMSYGSPQGPSCGGFSVDQLQKINFNTIDFVDPIYMWPSGGPNKQAGLAADMKVSSPSESDMNNQINKRIEEDLGQSGQQLKQLKAQAVEQVKETLQ